MSGKLIQAATMQALLMRNYYGFFPLEKFLSLADTGIGAYDFLDGEMILLDGVAYQAKADGTVVLPPADVTLPFCCGAKFFCEHTAEIDSAPDISALCAALNAAIPADERNLIHIAKITGTFSSMLLRSVERQSEPFAALETAQRKFSFENVEGTAVAVRCPDYMDRVNVAGWHLHFITADRTRGGHVFAVCTESARAEICSLDGFDMELPRNGIFNQLELTKLSNETVAQVEGK